MIAGIAFDQSSFGKTTFENVKETHVKAALWRRGRQRSERQGSATGEGAKAAEGVEPARDLTLAAAPAFTPGSYHRRHGSKLLADECTSAPPTFPPPHSPEVQCCPS